MTILALEFSSEQRSVALARDGAILAEATESGGYRVTHAFRLIEKVLEQAKMPRDEIEVIAVGLGPGSYTGIRAAIAIAQGWQLARGVKLLGVGSAECLAAQAQAEKIFGRVNVVIDAQRGEYYLATWEISNASRKQIAPLKIVALAEITAKNLAGEIRIGPEAGSILFPSAATVAQLATGRTNFVTGKTLEPVYLREVSFVRAPLARTF